MKKTIFVLSGGNADPFDFWREIASSLLELKHTKRIKVTTIPFAIKNSDGVAEANYFAYMFEKINPHLVIESLYTAGEYPKKLNEFIEASDIIFVPGGDGDLLQDRILDVSSIPDLKHLLPGKVVVGSSAGTNMWSVCYYSNDNKAIVRGLGIIPVKTFCHYHTSKWQKLTALSKYRPELPLIPLNEGEYIKYAATIF